VCLVDVERLTRRDARGDEAKKGGVLGRFWRGQGKRGKGGGGGVGFREDVQKHSLG
jgi:hypothetical protein